MLEGGRGRPERIQRERGVSLLAFLRGPKQTMRTLNTVRRIVGKFG